MIDITPGENRHVYILLYILVLIFIAIIIGFYIIKLSLENISYKDQKIEFSGDIWKYVGKVLLGMFLSIITIGIYAPWFIRDIQRFFATESSYNSQEFSFEGKGLKLLLILILTLFVPIIILTTTAILLKIDISDKASTAGIISQIISMIITIPYMYLIYKWMVDFRYKNYTIQWNTNFWDSCGKITLEMVLSIITIGIYVPLAWIRLYKYFVDKTSASSDEVNYRFGFDEDQLNDFLFLWGQLLLSIITLGIYYPWAYSKIGKRFLNKTYMEKVENV